MSRQCSTIALVVALTVLTADQVTFAANKSAPAPAPRRSSVDFGGIAGNHPYFYQGATGQAWAAKHAVGFRQIPFQTRIVSGSGHRHLYYSPYLRYYPYDGNYNYNYGYYPGSNWIFYSTGAYEPSPVIERRIVIVQAPQTPAALPSEPVTDGWVLLAAGDAAQAVGQFALDASKGDQLANVGYAIASGLRGEHGQAVWAMRKAVGEVGAAVATVPAAQAKSRVTTLIAQYETQARSRPSADVCFMLASLRFIDGDVGSAKAWLAKAVEAGDDSSSATALGAALEK